MESNIKISNNLVTFNPFKGPRIERVIYTTESQAEIWVACKMGGDKANRAYNESVSLILNGELNHNALFKAIALLIDRHESLRSVFSTDGRFMTIFEKLSITPFYEDISDKGTNERTAYLKDYITKEANYIYDLVKGPLFKVGLIKLSDNEHHLVLTAHHIICDGWSTGIMLEELSTLYSSTVLDKSNDLPKVDHFSAYADEQAMFAASDLHKRVEAFWLNQYKDKVPQLDLPTDIPRPELRTFKSERLDFDLNANLVSDLKNTGIKAGVSLVTALMATFEIFLNQQTGQEDIVVGLPSAGQAATGKTQLIGHCVNLLPLRSHVDLSISFKDYLNKRKPALFDAYDHQQLSFGELLKKLKIARDPSRVPLVPVIFNIDVGMSDQVAFTGLDYTLKSNPRAYEAFEIFLNATGSGNSLTLEWSYNSTLFKPETITKMMQDLEVIIERVIENSETELKEVLAIDNSAYKILNATASDYPKAPLHELILEQVGLNAEREALKFETETLNYKDLKKQVNQLSHCLLEHGVEKGSVVGICMPKSIELVVTLLAVMQCGATYLPLDSNFPESRLDFMLEDSNTNMLITSKTTKVLQNVDIKTVEVEALFSKLNTFSEHRPIVAVDAEDTVYILYTSGSTGKPKGVQITHRSLVNFLYSMKKEPGIQQQDRLLSLTTISFDIAGLELYLPLLAGASLILANEEATKDSRLLLELIEDEDISIVQATPTTWQMMLDANWDKPLNIKALCGGEALPHSLAQRILAKVKELWNMYGPTETTIWSSVKQIVANDERITIGKPIANTGVYIVNNGQLVMPGKTGEICISGDGVAKGYLNRPELNSERFITNAFDETSERLYRTGDLGQLLTNGEVECLGRLDQQVKIRGHRIELEEIEASIIAFDGVKSAVVLVNNDVLNAFIILEEGLNNLDSEQLKQHLALQLPLYMIPQKFNYVKEFPKTLNGKIDRKALLESSTQKINSSTYTTPRTASEKTIATIWEECLELNEVDVKSNFFEIGGHSLVAVRVMSLLEKETGKRLPLSALMIYPTIEKLANFIDQKDIKEEKKETWQSLVPIKPEGNKTPLYVVHGAGHNVLFFNSLAKNLDDDQPVYGLQAQGLNGVDKPYDKIEDMAAHYVSEIIQTNPEGPYALSGYSFGGIVAYEMARLLRAQNKEVTTLALFDTYVFSAVLFS